MYIIVTSMLYIVLNIGKLLSLLSKLHSIKTLQKQFCLEITVTKLAAHCKGKKTRYLTNNGCI